MAPASHPTGAIGSSTWKDLIVSGARVMGIEVTGTRMDQLVRFGTMLSDWNRRVNLTSITDPDDVAVKHFLDSMAALPYIPETGRLLDIGSGGGFPGLVLTVFRPRLQITAIDSVRKKVSFLQHVIRTLGLQNTVAIHTRAESLAEEKTRYNIIVSRALGSLDMLVTLSLPLIAEEGTMIAYKGVMNKDTKEEIKVLKSQHNDLSVTIHTYLLPSSGDQRSLVFISRVENG